MIVPSVYKREDMCVMLFTKTKTLDVIITGGPAVTVAGTKHPFSWQRLITIILVHGILFCPVNLLTGQYNELLIMFGMQ